MPARGSGIVINIGANGTEAKEVLAMVQQQLRETGAAGKQAGEDLAQSFEVLKGAIAAYGGEQLVEGFIEITAKIKEMIGAAVDLGMELGHASQQTGISAESMSVLKYASDVTGVAFEALVKGTGRLSKAMLEAEEGKKTSIQSFARLGISQQEVSQHSNDMLGMLGLVADKFQTLPDGPQKSAVALNLFSRAGIGLIPFLNQGSAGIAELAGEAKALGLVLDEDGVAKLEAMHRSAVQLKGGMEGVGLGITVGLEPALTAASNAIVAMIGGTDGWTAAGEAAGKAAIYFGEGLLEVVKYAEVADEGTVALIAEMSVFEAKVRSITALTSSQKAIAQADMAAAQKLADEAEGNAARAVLAIDKAQVALAAGLHPGPVKHTKGTGSINLQDQSGGGKGGDGIDRAEVSLAQAQAEAVAKAIKDADDSALVSNEAWHKLMLISDEEFYAEKLRIELQSLDAQETAIKSREGELQALFAKQQNDKSSKRDKAGNSKETLETQKQLVELASQLNALEAKRGQIETNASAEKELRAQQETLATLKIAAQVEQETNTTITARLALLRAENAIAIQKAGKDSPEAVQLQALERIKEAKLQIADVDRQIKEIEEDSKRATGELSDHAEKDPRFKLAAAKQINQINADEAAQLKVLVAQYDALAQTLGGQFTQNAKNLHAEMDKLNQPNKKQDADFTKTLGDGITHMAEQIGSASLSGKDSFHQMVQSMEKDVLELAIKLAAQKWLTPFLNGLMGGGGGGTSNSPVDDMPGGFPAFAGGGDYSGDSPIITSEDGPELMFPKGPGTVMPSSLLSSIAEGGGGKSPVTNINLTNASSQPVTARQTGSSFDADTRQYMTHVILEDLQQNGPIASALRPGG